jgi:iron complex outermembrane receptor protein
MKKLVFRNIIIFFFLYSIPLIAQTNGQFKGFVKDASDFSLLAGAIIQLEGTNIQTTTDINGHYKLEAPEGTYNIRVTYVGYFTQTLTYIRCEPGKKKVFNFYLKGGNFME